MFVIEIMAITHGGVRCFSLCTVWSAGYFRCTKLSSICNRINLSYVFKYY